MLDGLAEAAARSSWSATTPCRVAILTGEGKAFCAGGDIAAGARSTPLEMWPALGRATGHRVFDRLARLRQPLIAVLNGIALGGGLELAATADLPLRRGAMRSSACPRRRIGIVPGWSGTQRLVRRAGAPAVKRLALTGEPVDAERRCAWAWSTRSCADGRGHGPGAGARRRDAHARRRSRCRSPSS